MTLLRWGSSFLTVAKVIDSPEKIRGLLPWAEVSQDLARVGPAINWARSLLEWGWGFNQKRGQGSVLQESRLIWG